LDFSRNKSGISPTYQTGDMSGDLGVLL